MEISNNIWQSAEVHINGRTAYTGLMVLPFHIFEFEGHHYLLNINKTKTFEISYQTAALLSCCVGIDDVIPAETADVLHEFSLIAEKPEDLLTYTQESVSTSKFVQTLVLNVIQSCNLGCGYCFAGDGSYGDQGKMSFEVARDAMDWYRAQHTGGQLEINFFGGEPLANFRLIVQCVQYSRSISLDDKKDIIFSITTNGTLVTPEIARFLKINNFRIAVSIDGPPVINDRNRPTSSGKGSTAKVLNGIKVLRDHGIVPIARCTLYGDTDIGKVRHYLTTIGFDQIHVATATIAAGDRFGQLGIENAVAASIANSILERTEAEDAARDQRLLENQVSKTARSISLGERLTHACGVGEQIASVGRDGGLYACHRFTNNPEFKIGDTKSGLYEERFVDRRVDDIPKCRDCWVRYLCGGGCRHDNLSVGGHVFEPSDHFCREMKAHVEQSIVLACSQPRIT